MKFWRYRRFAFSEHSLVTAIDRATDHVAVVVAAAAGCAVTTEYKKIAPVSCHQCRRTLYIVQTERNGSEE